MTTTTKILHNPRCSKSRDALQLLEARGLDVEVIRYLDTPPSEQELREILKLLGIPAKDLVRRGEPLFKELGLGTKELTEAQWVSLLAANPKLIERPIVVHGDKAAIGRPLEQVEALFNT